MLTYLTTHQAMRARSLPAVPGDDHGKAVPQRDGQTPELVQTRPNTVIEKARRDSRRRFADDPGQAHEVVTHQQAARARLVARPAHEI
ncbi:hypothetical protein ACIQU4_11575 [Streptomyces sp. NPDC090741]|uniref:hypothetical protein n=1 Tax=Streptomyces sp. NPDC090741 TaxID=3365967 RepID=UPI00382ACAB1